MLRGGNDESTMGPDLELTKNNFHNCFTDKNEAMINLLGTQRSFIEKNNFTNCNTGKQLIVFEDLVRAAHFFSNNTINNSGEIVTNKYTVSKNNIIY
jgi:poly(beta-D-mannuronate) lyase